MDRSGARWRMNSSFSPVSSSRRWDGPHPSDVAGRWSVHDSAPPYEGSSPSFQSKGSRSGFGSDQFPNLHHQSMSDGALSCFGSPSDNAHPPRWTPPVSRFDHGEFSTPSGGSREETVLQSRLSERAFALPFSENEQMAASSSKHPFSFPLRHHPARRSFMSKPVYPVVYHRPSSDAGTSDASNADKLLPCDDGQASPAWLDCRISPEVKFHESLSELEKMEAVSPWPSTSASLRREGFRWSNASSYDFSFEGNAAVDIPAEHSLFESQRYVSGSTRHQKCGLCERPLQQKSPWSSGRIVQNSDMPIASILPCRHVFHADCLDEATSRSQASEPPCPVCSEVLHEEESAALSQPLSVMPDTDGKVSEQIRGMFKRIRSLPVSQSSGPLTRSRLRKKFQFRRNLFSGHVFKKHGSAPSSSSSNPPPPPPQRDRG